MTPQEEERAAIVAWLRQQSKRGDEHLEMALQASDERHKRPELWAARVTAINNAIKCIEHGHHLTSKPDANNIDAAQDAREDGL